MKQVDGSEYGDPDHTILEAYGLDMRPCTDDENENIKRFLTPESADLFDCAFRVHNKETDEAFENTVNGNILEKEIFISCIMDPVIRIGGELLRMDLC